MISSISSSASNALPSPDYTTTIRPHHGGHHGGASKAASSIISEADTDGDGSISKSELTTMLTKKLGGTESASAINSKVDAIFKQIDTDGNGEISKTELTTALKQAHAARQAQGTTASTSPAVTASLTAALSSLLVPPPDAGYDASGAATGGIDASTFSASA